jgi:hypothetical protein
VALRFALRKNARIFDMESHRGLLPIRDNGRRLHDQPEDARPHGGRRIGKSRL